MVEEFAGVVLHHWALPGGCADKSKIIFYLFLSCHNAKTDVFMLAEDSAKSLHMYVLDRSLCSQELTVFDNDRLKSALIRGISRKTEAQGIETIHRWPYHSKLVLGGESRVCPV